MNRYKAQGVAVGLLLVALSWLGACTGTQSAYRAAEGDPYKLAYVVTEQYASLVNEAADLKQLPSTPPEIVKAMQKADAAAAPAVDKLRAAAEAYAAVKNAQTQADLQAAIDNAVLLIADVIDAVKRARSTNL